MEVAFAIVFFQRHGRDRVVLRLRGMSQPRFRNPPAIRGTHRSPVSR
jgi:hypothetical protein